MSLANTKIVQAYIQSLIEVVNLIDKAKDKANAIKEKFVSLNPSLLGTSITQIQINAINTFIIAINDLANSQVSVVLKTKNQPSHNKLV